MTATRSLIEEAADIRRVPLQEQEAVRAIAQSFAEIQAGQAIPFEQYAAEARARREARRAARMAANSVLWELEGRR